jgi:hypothetical protein
LPWPDGLGARDGSARLQGRDDHNGSTTNSTSGAAA